MTYKERVILSVSSRIKDYLFADNDDDDTVKCSHLAWAILPTNQETRDPCSRI